MAFLTFFWRGGSCPWPLQLTPMTWFSFAFTRNRWVSDYYFSFITLVKWFDRIVAFTRHVSIHVVLLYVYVVDNTTPRRVESRYCCGIPCREVNIYIYKTLVLFLRNNRNTLRVSFIIGSRDDPKRGRTRRSFRCIFHQTIGFNNRCIVV